ncbi:MAG TPA: hypothetical protein VIJ99_02850 [Acidimicrobiales bacterium]
MTDDLSGFENIPFDPASMPASSLGFTKAVWYRRPWVLATLALIVVIAISVVIDLPRPITKAQDIASQNASIKEINSDLAECAFAVKESFNFYNLHVNGKLSPSDLSQVPTLLTGDETACSFASQPVYDLTNNIQVDDTAAGRHIDRMLTDVERWITDYALASIRDIQFLFNNPGNASAIHHLTTQEGQLASERVIVLSELAKADNVLGMKLDPVKIPSLKHLSGT